MSYWVTFVDGTEGCVEFQFDAPEPTADRLERVKRLTEQELGRTVSKVDTLPHPANPRLIKVVHEKYGACPSFCFQPRQCVGRSSCPRPYACDN